MSAYIAGFYAALVLAAIVLIIIAYCMFFKEKHKTEFLQYDINDIKVKSDEISQPMEPEEKSAKTATMAGIIFLPSRHKHHKDDTEYKTRPDYPETPADRQAGAEAMVDMFTESTKEDDTPYKDVSFEIDSCAAYHSDV